MSFAASANLERPLISKERFIGDLRDALDDGHGYAAGKLGNTEWALLQHAVVLEREHDPSRIAAFELALAHKALRHAGIFPGQPEFLRRFGAAFAEAVRALDCVGVYAERWPADGGLLRFHRIAGQPIDFIDHEPDRSSPNDERRCYLPLFRGRRLLLVAPFAELLRERATRETFEAVWRKTGKPWFEPASVAAVEFPYGFSPATWERHASSLALFDDIRARVEALTFDVALIAAGGLGSLIAAAVKEQGKIAISLGGHLQVLFGVIGKRWRERPDWQRDYFTDAWIDMPERYKPGAGESDENYW